MLIVLDLGRPGRELIRLVEELEAKGVGFGALKALFDTTTPIGCAFL